MDTEIVTIYDELDRPYVVKAERGGTRVLQVLDGPKPGPEPNSYLCRVTETDVRFGD